MAKTLSRAQIGVGEGEVAVFVENKDTMLHTFTIEELGVDLRIPGDSTARVEFDAPAGTYEYVCAPNADVMSGTLIAE